MDPVDLVIFDNDGVLVDSELMSNRVLADLLTEAGCPTTLEESIEQFMGGTLGAVRRLVQSRDGLELPGDFERLYQERLFLAFERDLEPVPGVREVLSRLTVPYCVASSGSVERIVRALTKTGLLPFFGGRIFSADAVAHGKPAPDVFLYAAESMGVAPARSVVVEDSPNGLRAARSAGMRVLGYTALTPRDRLQGADALFEDMGELPVLLESLQGKPPSRVDG